MAAPLARRICQFLEGYGPVSMAKVENLTQAYFDLLAKCLVNPESNRWLSAS